MTATPPGPDTPFRAPVTPSTVLVADDRARYTEVDGRAVVCRVDEATVHELSPFAAVIWGRIDGRATVAQVTDGLRGGPGAPTVREVVELVRRLRAMGLLRDEPADASIAVATGHDAARPTPSADPSGEPGIRIRVRGLLAGDPETLRIDGADASADPGDDDPDDGGAAAPGRVADSALVTLELGRPEPRADGHVLRRIEVVGRPEAGTPLSPFDALGALVARAHRDDLARTGALDLLAEVAEAVPVVAVGGDAADG